MKSNAQAVREFTKGAGQPAPEYPQPMTKEQVFFLSKMMLDEVQNNDKQVCLSFIVF